MLRVSARRRRASWAAAATVAVALAVAGCSSASAGSQASATTTLGAPTSAAEAAALKNPYLDLGTSLGDKPAANFKLVNQFGQPMSLSQFRGKVVLLGFIDSECTTICPLTTQSMLLAKELLGKAGSSVQLLGVDANPKATAVSDVMAYSREHGMVNQWDFLTGSVAQLKKAWQSYGIAVQIQAGLIDHTPALYIIDQQGRLRKIYMTQMAYSSVTQSAQVLATEASSLLPGHPKLSSTGSLAAIPAQGPTTTVSLPSADGKGTVTLGPGKPRLVMFFATWLAETSNLQAELKTLNAYAKAASSGHLPALTAVDETTTEPSVATVSSFLKKAGPLDYPVALDTTGRVADGYGVQNQPWLALVNSAGKITWQHDGWVPLTTLEKQAAAVK